MKSIKIGKFIIEEQLKFKLLTFWVEQLYIEMLNKLNQWIWEMVEKVNVISNVKIEWKT